MTRAAGPVASGMQVIASGGREIEQPANPDIYRDAEFLQRYR